MRRAEREQKVLEISSRIRSSSDIDSMLKTAVREIRQAVGAKRGAIRLSSVSGSPVIDEPDVLQLGRQWLDGLQSRWKRGFSMTYVIAVANEKGGVAKTTTALSLGAAMVEQRQKALVVDLDPQANLTLSLGIKPKRPEWDGLRRAAGQRRPPIYHP